MVSSIGADGGLAAAQRDGQLADRAAFPPQDQGGVRAGVVAVQRDVHLIEQGAQQLLAVLVGGGRGVPDGAEVIAEGEDRLFLLRGQGFRVGRPGGGRARPRRRPARGARSPIRLQAAGDQPVVRVDGPVAALGPGGVVAGLLDLALVLGQGRSWPCSSWSAAAVERHSGFRCCGRLAALGLPMRGVLPGGGGGLSAAAPCRSGDGLASLSSRVVRGLGAGREVDCVGDGRGPPASSFGHVVGRAAG